jgi:ATP-dependent Clp protease adaptor protein ClpS
MAVTSEPSLPEVIVTTRPKEAHEQRTRRFPPYNVILLNDDYHSFQFVIEVLRKVFGCTEQRAFQLAQEAHTSGRSIVWTGPREVAELKVEQIRSFHEIRSDGTKYGPLGCDLEPAAGG